MFRPTHLVVALLLLLLGTARADEKKSVARFELACSGAFTAEVPGEARPLQSKVDLHLRYVWTGSAGERVLTLESMTMTMTNDGRVVMDYDIDGNTMKRRQNGKEEVRRVEDLPPPQQAGVRDAFGKAIAIVTLKPDGSEASRKVLPTDAAKRLLGSDDPAVNILFFHPPAPPAEAEWTASRSMTAGDGGTVRGDLKYRKTSEAEGRTTYAVAGELRPANGQESAATLKIAGEATYDASARTWTSSRFDTDFEVPASTGRPVKGKLTYQIKPAQ